MLRGGLVLLMMLWMALPALAGPWPREAGRQFIANSVTLSRGHMASQMWVEHGLGRGRWIVAELGHDSASGWSGGIGLHRALPDLGRWKAAWSVGLGLAMPQGEVVIDLPPLWFPARREVEVKIRPLAALRLGLSLGRALETPWPGWAALDLRLDLNAAEPRWKADATLGYRPTERLALIFQMQAEARRGGTPHLALAPSVVWRGGTRMSVEIGLRQGLTGGARQIRLGTWLDF